MLDTNTRVGQEVDEGSLLDEIVLFVNTNILDLLFGGNEEMMLDLFSFVSPLAGELLSLVSCVDVVPVGKFGSNKEGEVSHFRHTQVPSDDVFVVEDHATKPLVVRPAAHSRKRSNGADVEEEEDKPATTAAQRLVVRGDLLGANCLEQGLHVIVVREGDRVLGCVIRVLIAFAH